MSEGTEAGQSRGSREQQAACVGQGGNHRTGAGRTDYGHIVKGCVCHTYWQGFYPISNASSTLQF